MSSLFKLTKSSRAARKTHFPSKLARIFGALARSSDGGLKFKYGFRDICVLHDSADLSQNVAIESSGKPTPQARDPENPPRHRIFFFADDNSEDSDSDKEHDIPFSTSASGSLTFSLPASSSLTSTTVIYHTSPEEIIHARSAQSLVPIYMLPSTQPDLDTDESTSSPGGSSTGPITPGGLEERSYLLDQKPGSESDWTSCIPDFKSFSLDYTILCGGDISNPGY